MFGINAGLNGVAAGADVLLADAEGDAGGGLQLQGYDVLAGEQFGYAVFHLKARVHFQEVEMSVRGYQELHGASVGVAQLAPQLAGEAADLGAHLGGQLGRRRGFLNELLVAALDGAVPFMKVQDIAVLVGDELHFNVGCALEIALVEQAGIGEGGLGSLAGAGDDGFQFGQAVDDVDADAAAAGRSLDHHRESHGPGLGDGLVILDRFLGAGHNGQAGFAGNPAGREFVCHLVEDFLAGADEGDAGGLAAAGQGAVFGEKAVTGMDGLGASGATGVQDGVYVEVGCRSGGAADGDGFVGQGGMQCAGVSIGIDGDGGDAQPPAGADDASGDFATVGD